MASHSLVLMALLTFLIAAPLYAAGPLAIVVEEQTQCYTITEQGQPVLTYRFGEVPLPKGVKASHFSKRDTPYNGAYFTDGSQYGGAQRLHLSALRVSWRAADGRLSTGSSAPSQPLVELV